jgi:hypothetical protein
MKKPWWQSKTKWGAILLGAGQAMPAVAEGVATGQWATALPALLDAVGILAVGFGVRNALPQ